MMNNEQAPQFVAVCLDNADYEVSLEVGKRAKAHGYIRMIDESEEDCAFSANRFYLWMLPEAIEQVLLASSK